MLPPILPVMVVEYLEPPMSTDLLSKFPDNSAFDFDYSQSSIWSPLLPPPPDFGRHRLDISRKLSYDEAGLLENTKKIGARLKRKFTDTVLNNVGRCSNTNVMKRRKRPSFGISPINSSSSPTPKLWAKVMKAAANKFNNKRRKKKDSNYLPQS